MAKGPNSLHLKNLAKYYVMIKLVMFKALTQVIKKKSGNVNKLHGPGNNH